MFELLRPFFVSFIPLFVAIDVLAVVPLFISMTDRMSDKNRRQMVTAASLTAFAVSLLFLATGRFLFSFLGITDNDFRVGGGLLLLAISITDLIYARAAVERRFDANVGVVPIGVPLIIGPAALTTILILVDSVGYWLTLAALVANLVIVWFVFRNATMFQRLMGRAGSAAFARIMSIFMAAIAVMMIRAGISGFLR